MAHVRRGGNVVHCECRKTHEDPEGRAWLEYKRPDTAKRNQGPASAPWFLRRHIIQSPAGLSSWAVTTRSFFVGVYGRERVPCREQTCRTPLWPPLTAGIVVDLRILRALTKIMESTC